jgi:hypothetical protein
MKKKKRPRYRAALIALAAAALSLTILGVVLRPLWGVHRAVQSARHSHPAGTAAP